MSKRRHNFGTKRFKEKSLFIFHARIALKSLILLFVRLIARGARIGKTHTHTHTHRQTDRQDKYCNPRACAPRVNDDTLDFLAMRCENKADKYFCALAKLPEYKQFGSLALELLCMSPDTVECERAFSHMNLMKRKYSARLTQENLQARMCIYMDSRTLEEFPFHCFSRDNHLPTSDSSSVYNHHASLSSSTCHVALASNRNLYCRFPLPQRLQ